MNGGAQVVDNTPSHIVRDPHLALLAPSLSELFSWPISFRVRPLRQPLSSGSYRALALGNHIASMQECMRASEIRNSEMTAHHQDRAHNNEGNVPNHNGCESKRRKHWGTKQTTPQNIACASDVGDTRYAFKRVKTRRDFNQPLETGRLHPSVYNEGKVITEEGDEGTEETIPVSENRERRPSSPQPILENFEKLQEIVAKHNSLRDMARREIQKRYAPATQDAGPATPTAPQSDEYDSFSNNDMQQLNMPSSTVEDKHTHHSPHYHVKLNTTSASQESFDGEWLDNIDPALWPDGNPAVHNPGSGAL